MDPLPPGWSTLQASEADADPSLRASAPSRQLPVVAALGVVLIGAVVVVAAVLGSARPGTGSVSLPSDRPNAIDSGDEILVEVGGAVRHPGLVRLPAGSRIADAIAAAGGYSAAVDAAAASRDLHLAQTVADGDQVTVPGRGETAPTSGGSGAPGVAGPIDVNSATESELDTLPGIGPVTAAKIIEARTERPFTSIDDLVGRKVVGPATLAKIRDLIVVH